MESQPHPMPHFSIAIVEPNTLTALGLQQLLLDMIPMIKVRLFRDFCELESADDGLFAHYFVSSRIFFEHASYFHAPSRRAIVLTTGETAVSGVPTLNVCQSEAMLAKALMMLHHRGHQHNHTAAHCQKRDNGSHQLLTTREEEVAILLAKGNINKEIADRLNISITTVITHRKNIMEKLQARSLADIIIYVVMNGLADIGEL